MSLKNSHFTGGKLRLREGKGLALGPSTFVISLPWLWSSFSGDQKRRRNLVVSRL